VNVTYHATHTKISVNRARGSRGVEDATDDVRRVHGQRRSVPALRALRVLRLLRVPLIVTAAWLGAACDSRSTTVARSTGERAATRAYDGAPPPIPHDATLGRCDTCHDQDGTSIAGVGVAPASPHGAAAAAGGMQRCRQCHVPTETRAVFVGSRFMGLPQGPWKGGRATPGAPPTVPHTLQLRENCLACHSGPGARVEIRTSHPERVRCRQCHVPE
jgi:nitrate reductase cytochrome c-type subunit